MFIQQHAAFTFSLHACIIWMCMVIDQENEGGDMFEFIPIIRKKSKTYFLATYFFICHFSGQCLPKTAYRKSKNL